MLHGWGGSDRVPHARLCTARAVRLEEEVGLGRSPAYVTQIYDATTVDCKFAQRSMLVCQNVHALDRARSPGLEAARPGRGRGGGGIRWTDEDPERDGIPSTMSFTRRDVGVIIKATHRMLGCFRDNALTRQFLGMAG